MPKHVWRKANLRLIPSALLLIIGAVVGSAYGPVLTGNGHHKLIALTGILVFIVFAITFLHVITDAVHRLMSSHRLRAGQASTLQFIFRTIGYVGILIMTLSLLGISVQKLLVGSAVLGIILGVAAQQALANFFASIILIISRPFTVGESITLKSGTLGGRYDGLVIDIGLTHTKLQEDDGNIVFLPNATLLGGAAIMAYIPKSVASDTVPAHR